MTTVLVLGGYGLIGRAIVCECLKRDCKVVGFGRSRAKAYAANRDIEWRLADLRTLTTPQDFAPIIEGVDVVINASGALQTGGGDHVARTQETAMIALIDACEAHGVRAFVQISAPGVRLDDPIEFYATKAAADAHLARSTLRYTILRPGLVLSPTAYGGTTLLRMLAAVPIVQPIAYASAPLQTVHVDTVAKAAARALEDDALARKTFDLVEAKAHSLGDVVLEMRRWLGFPAPRTTVRFGRPTARLLGRAADMAGHLGWRSPLRTTAMKVLETGVVGDPEPWRRATGETPGSLKETLAALPSTPQERMFARSALVFPGLLCLLSGFWFLSGVVGLANREAAIALIAGQVGRPFAAVLLFGGAALDILVAAGLLWRRTVVTALLASVGVCLAYLAMGTILTPDIWLDPLGPFVKVLPVVGLSVALLAQTGER